MAQKEHFLLASEEVSRGEVDPAIWAMALAESDGDRDRAVAGYLRIRAEELYKEELHGRVAGAARKTARVVKEIVDVPVTVAKTLWEWMANVLAVMFGIGILVLIFRFLRWMFTGFTN